MSIRHQRQQWRWQQQTSLLRAESTEPVEHSSSQTQGALWTMAGHSQPGLSEQSLRGGHQGEGPAGGGGRRGSGTGGRRRRRERRWRRGGRGVTFPWVQGGGEEGERGSQRGRQTRRGELQHRRWGFPPLLSVGPLPQGGEFTSGDPQPTGLQEVSDAWRVSVGQNGPEEAPCVPVTSLPPAQEYPPLCHGGAASASPPALGRPIGLSPAGAAPGLALQKQEHGVPASSAQLLRTVLSVRSKTGASPSAPPRLLPHPAGRSTRLLLQREGQGVTPSSLGAARSDQRSAGEPVGPLRQTTSSLGNGILWRDKSSTLELISSHSSRTEWRLLLYSGRLKLDIVRKHKASHIEMC